MKGEMPKRMQRLWKKYGFKTNPFDTCPLIPEKETFLPISEAIVGRGTNTRESQILTNVISSEGGARIVIEGNIGVGKTTFVNYHRYLWENHAEDKLFTTQGEISVTEGWQRPHLMVNLLASLITKLLIVEKESKIARVPVFKEVMAFTKVLFNSNFGLEGYLMGTGGGFSSGEQVSLPIMPETRLLYYLKEMVLEIKKLGYSGVFFHLDNLELLKGEDIKKARTFFEDIRDSLQIRDVYFVFVGTRGFFREVISPLKRVRSIFYGRPIVIPPLTKSQVMDAVHRRYKLLAIKKDQYLKPVEDKFIEYLYDLYKGNLRYIMDALNMLLPEMIQIEAYTITTKEAKEKLGHLVVEQVQEKLTVLEWEIFHFCAGMEQFTNAIISKRFRIPSSNAARIINRLLELDLIYMEGKDGRKTIYSVCEFTRIIRDFVEEVTDTAIKAKVSRTKNLTQSQRIKQVISLLEKQKEICHKDYGELFNISLSTTTRDLNELVKRGHLKPEGKGRNKHYIFVE